MSLPLRILCITDLHGRMAALGRILAHAGSAEGGGVQGGVHVVE